MTKEELAQYVCDRINGQGPVTNAEAYANVISIHTKDGDFCMPIQEDRLSHPSGSARPQS